MAKRKPKKSAYKPIETKNFVDTKTGYHVRVARGTDVDMTYDVPHYMNGVDFRKWMRNTKAEVQAWLNYEEEVETVEEN